MQVTYFQRQPRRHANFSIERVFDDVRRELAGEIEARVCIAPCRSNGILRRLWIAWHAGRRQGEINHVTGDTNFTALALNGKRTVLTNHDCGYIVRSRGLRRWLLTQLWLKLPVNHVAAVTVVSSQIKEEVVRYTGCPEDKVFVIPNAVSPEFRPAPKPFDEAKPRILHVGTAPNKNLPRLIAALSGMSCTLVIIGRIHQDDARRLNECAVEYENYVNLSAPEIVREYERCDLVAFATLYEGFGLPILEAQAVGRPLLTSNRRPMSEIAGQGACLVDPMDIEEIRGGIARIMRDADYRNRIVEQGLLNVRRYQPHRIADEYFELYRRVLAAAEGSSR